MKRCEFFLRLLFPVKDRGFTVPICFFGFDSQRRKVICLNLTEECSGESLVRELSWIRVLGLNPRGNLKRKSRVRLENGEHFYFLIWWMRHSAMYHLVYCDYFCILNGLMMIEFVFRYEVGWFEEKPEFIRHLHNAEWVCDGTEESHCPDFTSSY